MKLASKLPAAESLLFASIGVLALGEGEESTYALIVCDTTRPDEWQGPLLVLPDPEHPLAESERLAHLLGKAVGQGSIHL